MDKQIKERGIIFNCEMVRAILDGRKTQTRRVIKSPATTLHNNGTNCIAYREAGDPWYKDYVFSMRNRSGVWNDYTLPQFLDLCPFGKVGDRLWVRETFATLGNEDGHPIDWDNNLVSERKNSAKVYRASCHQKPNNYGLWTVPDRDSEFEGPWTPSIHMPRWASRITLEITDIRVERLHGINEEDAKAEGVRQGVRKIHHEADNELIYCNYLASKRDDASEWFDSPIDSFLSLWESIYGAESWQHGPWVWVVEFKRVEAA